MFSDNICGRVIQQILREASRSVESARVKWTLFFFVYVFFCPQPTLAIWSTPSKTMHESPYHLLGEPTRRVAQTRSGCMRCLIDNPSSAQYWYSARRNLLRCVRMLRIQLVDGASSLPYSSPFYNWLCARFRDKLLECRVGSFVKVEERKVGKKKSKLIYLQN